MRLALLLPFLSIACVTAEGVDPAECTDEIDNDENGLIDCDDDGCLDYDFCQAPPHADLRINEFMASNATTVSDASGAFPDWIELYNPTAGAISVEGMTITDDLLEPAKHVLGALEIPAGGFLLLFADGDVDQGDNHLGFSLSKAGEAIGLYLDTGEAVDELEYGQQATDLSAARVPDGSTNWEIVEAPTPGESNN